MTEDERSKIRAKDAAYRERNREHIRAYNRAYKERKRAEALAKRQKTWTRAEWEAWEARKLAKERGSGTPAGLVNDVVTLLAEEQGLAPDLVLERLLESGGVDFLVKGAEALGRARAGNRTMIEAAARAVILWVDFDNATLCRAKAKLGRRRGKRKVES